MMKKTFLLTLILFIIHGANAQTAAVTYKMKQAPLMTRWSGDVSPTNALPEYPRPQMVRPKWLNLNGIWEFSAANEGELVPLGKTLPEQILVPYPVESPLSGLMRNEDRMWYRRTFTLPSDWSNQHVLLNFGAVDWKATVYLNGKKVGEHVGGYCAFTIDITSHLHKGENELIVNAYDPTDYGNQPTGKQTRLPRGYWYTASSGIWQTVWLEAVPASYITRLKMTPDIQNKKLRLSVEGTGSVNQIIEAVASVKGKIVGKIKGVMGKEMDISIPDVHLWSPDDPFLYDIKVSLKNASGITDVVTGYFGMRSIAVGKIAGITRPLLNGKFVFQIGPLDQGFWPDGNYTAPTDEALRFDLEQEKLCGYNMVRKHIKVEPARWFYWADKLGILVWQDMPSMTPGGILTDGTLRKDHHVATDEDKKVFETEYKEMIDQCYNSPATIGWVEFNEGWGEYTDKNEVIRLAKWIKSYDPSRLLNVETGVGRAVAEGGDCYDWHTYPGPGSPPTSDTHYAGEGEFGGIGLVIKDHSWTPVNKSQDTEANYTARYIDMISRVKELMYSPGLSNATYTQITDVENERNGLLTYDRAIFKADMAALRAAHQELIDASLKLGQYFTDTLGTDFKDATKWSSKDGDWKLTLGRYTNSVPGMALAQSNYNNLSAEVDIRAVTEGEAGLVFRVTNEVKSAKKFRGYFAGVSSDSGLTLSYAKNGQWSLLKAVPMNIKTGESYHLKIEAFGGTIRVYFQTELTPAIEMINYTSLTGAIGVRATNAKSQFSNLKVNNPFIRLKPLKMPAFVSHDSRQKDLVRVDNNVNHTDDAFWKIVPGLADSKGVSFESARMSGYYLRDLNKVITFEKNDGSTQFKNEVTWYRKSVATESSAYSYESYLYLKEYLRQNNRTLIRSKTPSKGVESDSTFIEIK